MCFAAPKRTRGNSKVCSSPPITIPPKLPPRVDNNPPLLPPVVSNPPTRVFNPPPVVIDTPPRRVVKIDPPPVIKPVIDRCFGGRCRPPVLGGPVKPIDGGIRTVATGPKPGRTPPTFGRGNGPVFTNIGVKLTSAAARSVQVRCSPAAFAEHSPLGHKGRPCGAPF